ncbi:MAG: hypothetical protein Q9186_004606 [Xanthomendoza sp. 1 TL-2023]
MAPQICSREELLASLRGRTLNVPDLQALLSHWPQYVHLELDRLRRDVDAKLHEVIFKDTSMKRTEPDVVAQIETFFQEFEYFIDMTDVEQRAQMGKQIPSVEEYLQRRMGSSAVRVCLAITE